jgi:hypothetical protein
MIWQWFLYGNAMFDEVRLDGRAVKAGITAARVPKGNYRQPLCI